MGNFLTSSGTACFSRMTLLYGVNYVGTEYKILVG